MRIAILLIGIVLLGGCVPCSEQPLSIPGQDKLDDRLYGTWFQKENDETVFIHFGTDYKTKLMTVVFVDLKKDGELECMEFIVHNTKSKESGYLNFRWAHPENDCSGYLFVKYTLHENSLGICVIDYATVKEAIESGELRGRIDKEPRGSSLMIEEESGKLKEFVEQHDGKLFPEMHYLQKLKKADLH